jgi:thiamine biosynthesis lipoprotein
MPQRHIEHCMGTVFSFDIRGAGVDNGAITAAVDWLHWVDETFSTYKVTSEIERIARRELALENACGEVQDVLARCAELEWETSGFFSAYATGVLDPSGLVKGWAIQRASDMLVAAGSSAHCVNGGGDMVCIGQPKPGEPWRIGITHPSAPGRLAGIVVAENLAIATSGAAERGDHIARPPGRGGDDVASVTIVGSELGTVDAYATAAFAMGTDAEDWIERIGGFEGLVVRTDGHVWRSSNLLVR